MKIAIISDLHISTRWIGSLSIEKQSRDLADRLVEYCKLNDIHYLFIAGDIIDKAIDRPEISHAVKYVFNAFSKYFEQVYYILGQHDMSVNPIGEIKDTDTLITLFEFPNVFYGNGKIITLGNTKIGMANFSRNSEYKLPEYVDLYITHFTISNKFGQTIDQSKFGTMIAGDIHHKVDIGNMHSIGSFQQQSVAKDSEWNNVCIWDCDTHEFEHVNIEGGLILRNSETQSGLVDGVFYELKRSPIKTENSPLVDKFKDDNYARIIQKVAEFMAENNLEDMNNEVSSQIEDVHSFSTDFSIEHFKVYNFRKIKEFEVSFDLGDKVLLTGKNGSGKSTFLISLFAALTGNLTWSSVQGCFDNEVYTEITINYAGNKYILRRGSGYQWLTCDGVNVPYKNRNDFNGVVLEKLPFLSDLDILFQRPEVGTLFEGMNSGVKLNLVSKIYHLEYLDQLYNTGEKIKSGYVNKANELSYNIKQLKFREDKLLVELLPYDSIKSEDPEALNNRFNELTSLQLKAEEYKKIESKILKINADIDANRNLLFKNNERLASLNKSEYEASLDSYRKLTEAKSKLDSLQSDLLNVRKSILSNKSEVESIQSSKCPRCNQTWINDESKLELDKLIDLQSRLNERYNTIEVEINGLDSMKSQFDSIPTLKSIIDTYNETVNSCNFTIDSCNREISRLSSELESMNIPEKVEFTSENLDELLNIKDKLSQIREYNNKLSDLNEVITSSKNQQTELDGIKSKIDELNLYNWYVCKLGPIYKGILESLCEQWSNDCVKFSVFVGKYRGFDYLDIKISYLKGSNWQDYSASSSGEKSYMDILFIEAVTANAGFLILDEFLRHMDDDVHIKSIDEINKINVNLFILSSFNPNLYFANKRIYAKYLPEFDECKLEVE